MYITLFSVTLYDDNNPDGFKEYGILYAKSYSDAALQIDKYYGDTLISMEITQYVDSLFTYTSEDFHNKIIKIVEEIP